MKYETTSSDGGHWYDRLPPMLLVVVGLALLGASLAVDDHVEALIGLAGVFTGAAIVLEALRGR